MQLWGGTCSWYRHSGAWRWRVNLKAVETASPKSQWRPLCWAHKHPFPWDARRAWVTYQLFCLWPGLRPAAVLCKRSQSVGSNDLGPRCSFKQSQASYHEGSVRSSSQWRRLLAALTLAPTVLLDRVVVDGIFCCAVGIYTFVRVLACVEGTNEARAPKKTMADGIQSCSAS